MGEFVAGKWAALVGPPERLRSPQENRKSWMRRARRAKEGKGYKVVTMPAWKDPITGEIRRGKRFVLKDDGRRVIELKPGVYKIIIPVKDDREIPKL